MDFPWLRSIARWYEYIIRNIYNPHPGCLKIGSPKFRCFSSFSRWIDGYRGILNVHTQIGIVNIKLVLYRNRYPPPKKNSKTSLQPENIALHAVFIAQWIAQICWTSKRHPLRLVPPHRRPSSAELLKPGPLGDLYDLWRKKRCEWFGSNWIGRIGRIGA